MRPHARGRPYRTPLFVLFILFGALLGLGIGSPASAQDWCPPPEDELPCDPGPPRPPPLVLDVTLNPLVATAVHGSTTAEPTDWGAKARTIIPGPSPSGTLRVRWRFTLAFNQRLEVLPDGKLVVLADVSSNAVPSEEDFPDAEPLDPAEGDVLTDGDSPGSGPDDLDAPYVEDGEDPGDNGPPTPNEGAAALEAIASAQEQVDDEVLAVGTPPVARDRVGNPIGASFSVSGQIATLTVHGGGLYPITLDGELVESLEGDAANEPEEPAGLSATAAPCPVRPQIVTYNPNGWFNLLNEFKANPTACADYFIVIPGTAENKTVFRRRISGRRIVDTVCEGTAANSVGARFFPVAEFHWSDWEKWLVARYGAVEAAKPSRWLEAGTEFRKGMHNMAGYGTPCLNGPDILPFWAINELPDNPRDVTNSGDFDNSFLITPLRRRQAIQLVLGLHDGPDGPATPWRNTPGIVFPGVHHHSEWNFKGSPAYPNETGYVGYHERLRDLLLRRSWWNQLRPRVKFWGQEVFTNCWKVCLPQILHVPSRGKLVSDYAYHPMHFLDAGIAAGSAGALQSARVFLRDARTPDRPGRYLPLLTGYWGPASDPNVRSRYGETNGLSLDVMKGHVSLQIYTVKRKVQNHPRPRIGFSWYNPAGPELAAWIAERLRATFGQGGLAENACFEVQGGTDWCQKSVPPRTEPRERRTRWARCWRHNFRSWTNATSNCA
jgi:hypothetical protein